MDMLGFSTNDIMKALIAGFVWGVTYLYIRRYLNPKTQATYKEFESDAFYGGIAAAAALLMKQILNQYI
jgi:hypothetical protein